MRRGASGRSNGDCLWIGVSGVNGQRSAASVSRGSGDQRATVRVRSYLGPRTGARTGIAWTGTGGK